jgi:hypothetical protein
MSDLTAFDLGPRAVADIAERLNRWLASAPGERASAESDLVEAVRSRWSWEGVAEAVIAASGGDLEALDAVPSE